MPEPRIRFSSRIARGVSVGSSSKVSDFLLGLVLAVGIVLAVLVWFFRKLVEYWPVLVPIVIVVLGLWWYAKRVEDDKRVRRSAALEDDAERRRRQQVLMQVSKMILRLSEKSVTYSRKARLAEEALELLQPLLGQGIVDKFAGMNPEQFRELLQAMIRCYPVLSELEKAERARFAGDATRERKALLSALFMVERDGIEDGEFATIEIQQQSNDKPISRHALESRARELGWKGPGQ